MGYIVCEECGDYYELQPGEHPEDFNSCYCGGKLKYKLLMNHEDYTAPIYRYKTYKNTRSHRNKNDRSNRKQSETDLSTIQDILDILKFFLDLLGRA